MYKVDLPLSVWVSDKKKFLINLNAYRNEHYYSLNKAKVVFKEEIYSQLKNLPLFGKVRLHYILYPGSKRELDIMNICSVADKFFCDALVEAGKLPDDNYNYLTGITIKIGSIDKTNPRVEVYIEELDKMQITLEENEINEAIEQYVRGQISIKENQVLNFDFKAARGDHGMTATVSIQNGKASPSALSASPVGAATGTPTAPTQPIPPTPTATPTAPTTTPTPAAAATQIKAEPVKENPTPQGIVPVQAQSPAPASSQAPAQAPSASGSEKSNSIFDFKD